MPLPIKSYSSLRVCQNIAFWHTLFIFVCKKRREWGTCKICPPPDWIENICYITYAAIAYCKKKQIVLRALKKQLEKNSESYGIRDDADNTWK